MAKFRGIPPQNYTGNVIHLKEAKYIRKMKSYRRFFFISLAFNFISLIYLMGANV